MLQKQQIFVAQKGKKYSESVSCGALSISHVQTCNLSSVRTLQIKSTLVK